MKKGKQNKNIQVAIMTLHMAKNYGAMLQAYALQKTIENLGYQCEILDYRQHYIYKRDGVYRWKEFVLDSGFIKGNARFLWRHIRGTYRNLSLSKKRFDLFLRNNLKLSKNTIFKKEKLRKTKYDVLIFGSDQIWNPVVTGGFSPEYLGAYFDNNETKFISYAASCGADHLPDEYLDEYVKRLHQFSSVSVREKSLSRFLNEQCQIKAESVLDPVLLTDSNTWEELIAESEIKIDQPYLLVYSFDAGDDIYKLGLRIAHERQLKPVAICYNRLPQITEYEQLLTCGPNEFLYLFRNADFICTTSFHGVAFSILMEKNFYCMAHPVVGQRERDLTEMVGLNDRLLENAEELKEVTDCLYTTDIKGKVSFYRNQSIQFLKDSLAKAIEQEEE